MLYFEKFYIFCFVILTINAGKILSADDCGTKYGCFKIPNDCEDQDCDYLIKWKDNKDSTDFVMKTRALVSNFYYAIGFSYDRKMGDDCVVMCKYASTSSSTIEHYFNPHKEKTSEVLDSKNRSIGLSNLNITLSNDFLVCAFKRQKTAQDNPKYYDLNKMYYLLIAKGYLDPDNEPNDHKKNKYSSSYLIDFKTNYSTNASLVSFNLNKAHAIIMMTTWMILATSGILFSRYFKSFNQDLNCFGVQPWFFYHRLLMFSTVIFSLIGLAAIFYKNDWNWISTSLTTNFIHSVFGIASIGLALLQPIYAAFRPAIDHPKRPIFNWIHRSFGILSYLLAIISIALGLYIYMSGNQWVIVVGWVGWLIFLIILMEISNFKNRTNKEKTCLIKNQENDVEFVNKTSMLNGRLQLYIMIFHLAVTIILVSLIQFFLINQIDN
ncbi:unnamed protein product [Brachionus calyciflorus]|uniref:Ferric-chelate reductase 1 n=1 Tax=Brachionus calyciflorus TaxID=104777 RepID=A0A814JC13_9BILA|nr:unnamed protein product [Brachionus calyciflorus]